MNEQPWDEQEKPSKSARKREAAGLVELAGQMAELKEQELQKLGVSDALRAALALVRPMRPSGARNRQLRHCTKFMQPEALGDVVAYLDDRQSQQVALNRRFHAIERWRERLIAEGDEALQALCEHHPAADRQQLRQLMRDAAREQASGAPRGAARKLFRYLRELIGADPDADADADGRKGEKVK